MKTRFTDRGPAIPAGTQLSVTVELGFEYTVDSEGRINYLLDDKGVPVAKRWVLPLVPNTRQLVAAFGRVAQVLARHGINLDRDPAAAWQNVPAREDVWLELMGAMVAGDTGSVDDGIDVIRSMATWPGVHPEDFEELCAALLAEWGFDTYLDDLFGPVGEGAGDNPPPLSGGPD